MTRLPQSLLDSLRKIEGFDEDAFKKVHQSCEQITSIRINPLKLSNENFDDSHLTIHDKILWTDFGFYLIERPSFTFDPYFHAGCYYVQEASSMFLEEAFKQTVDLSHPLKVLDLAAAPGGKSTHIQSLISADSILVSNEVIKSRANILKDNIVKWGCNNVIVTNNDPKDFTNVKNYFDVIIVDAPCSGSGLFRRDEEAVSQWSLNNVQLCSRRQQRILADVLPSLKKNGILIYSTCSFSKEENEEIVDWMIGEFEIENLKLKIEKDWNITETKSDSGAYCYRFWPDKIKGEGFFISVFMKKYGEQKFPKQKNKVHFLNKRETGIVKNWLNEKEHELIRKQNIVYAVPEKLLPDINFISDNLRIFYFGTIVGELIAEKLIPHHALAMSNLVSENISRAMLNYEQAIEYLKKKEPELKTQARGWQLAVYNNHTLGWMNVLANRINNYYPKELRILKDL